MDLSHCLGPQKNLLDLNLDLEIKPLINFCVLFSRNICKYTSISKITLLNIRKVRKTRHNLYRKGLCVSNDYLKYKCDNESKL